MNRVDGKVALVTGATRGIGAETARLLAQAGAKVVVTGRQEALGRAVADEIAGAGGAAAFVALDVTREADWEQAIRTTVERYDGLHITVNNAGIYLQRNIEDMSLEEWRRISATNLEGVFLGTKHSIGAMKATVARGGGSASIVNVSSISAMVGMAFSTAYSMSKGGIRAFTKSAALECAELGYKIRINSVHPTFVETDMADEVMEGYARIARSKKDPQRVREALTRLHPLRRFATPLDVARAILFLASDESDYMTGAELVVDGGFTAG